MNNENVLIEKVFAKKGFKFLLFLFSYLILCLFISLTQGGLELFIFVVVYFPAGFGWPILKLDNSSLFYNLMIGWLSYFLITLFGVLTENIRTAKIIYFIFVVLLILNFVGCSNSDIRTT